MKGQKIHLVARLKKYFVDIFKTEGNIKLGDARGKIVLLKDIVVVMNLEDIIILLAR